MLKNFLLDLIFPIYCPGCEKELASKQALRICDTCFHKIPLNSGMKFHVCDLSKAGICEKFLPKTSLNGIFAAGNYENAILREMIRLFKYRSVESFKKPLAELVIKYISKESLTEKLENSALIPIPLALRRKSARGFNQSELLAEEIGKFLNCPVINLLKREKFTDPQAEISDWRKRKENVSGVFAINNKIPTEQFNVIKKAVLIDDVATSGATLEEAAAVLKEFGIKEIYGLVIAKG